MVLDCLAGSGITLAVADALQRRWIGVDNSPEALRTILEHFTSGLWLMGDFIKLHNSDHPQASLFD